MAAGCRLSSNTDLTFDAVDAIVARGLPRPLLVAEVDPHLPWLDGVAAVDAGWFDIVIAPPAPHPPLFALPREPVGDADYAIGLHASTLVRDGGTLQIGIGALSDALCHALVLRHTDNAAYRRGCCRRWRPASRRIPRWSRAADWTVRAGPVRLQRDDQRGLPRAGAGGRAAAQGGG
jgi:hypothetical protein